jgi:hypothetical protein
MKEHKNERKNKKRRAWASVRVFLLLSTSITLRNTWSHVTWLIIVPFLCLVDISSWIDTTFQFIVVPPLSDSSPTYYCYIHICNRKGLSYWKHEQSNPKVYAIHVEWSHDVQITESNCQQHSAHTATTFQKYMKFVWISWIRHVWYQWRCTKPKCRWLVSDAGFVVVWFL